MTLAAITMTAPEVASPVQMYRATYSPDDNKLRLYAVSRLDQETYKKVHDAGFRWAPKQALFVAPAWTPGREDVLLSLAGEIEDEDSTLAERQEARAERFTGYSGKRASESAQALDEVERLAAMIPPGQPILVGHHSERRARRDAQRIENGMKRAVMLFERAEYWEERARSALLHAKYKERPDVRWRRIKKIEADLRKAEKTIAQSQKYLTMWRAESLDLNMAKLISSHDHISACFPLDTYPRPAEKSQYEGSRSLWSALDDDIITTEQAREIAIRCHERQIQHQQRWVKTTQFRAVMSAVNMLPESERPRVVGLGPTHRAVGEMRSAGVDAQTLTEQKRPVLTLKRKTEGETPVRSRKTIINVTTPPKWKVKKQKLAEKAAREAELAAKKAQARQALSIYLNLPSLDEAVNTLKPWWPGLFDGDTPRLLACGIRDVLLEDVAQRNIPLSHKKLRRALKAITRSESYLCAMKAGACRYDTEGYVTEHISQEEEAYAAERLDKIRRQNRIKAELQAVLDEK